MTPRHADTPSSTSPPRLIERICGPAELLQAVPYLIGFQPQGSLVLVGLADGRLVVTARLDLADSLEPGLLEHTVAGLAHAGSELLVGMVFPAEGDAEADVATLTARAHPDDALPWRSSVVQLCAAVAGGAAVLGDVLLAVGGRWWSYLCREPDCCPPNGKPLPAAPSPFAVASTVAGVRPHADRQALAAQLDGLPEQARWALDPLLAEAEQALVAEILAGHAGRWRRGLAREIIATAHASDRPGWAPLPDPDVARLGVALGEIEVRDEVWLALEAGADGRALWRDLACRLPSPLDAPALFLFGWAAWRAGNGALANVAVDRALASDPAYTAADILRTALCKCVDPHRLPPLKLPRAARRNIRTRDLDRQDATPHTTRRERGARSSRSA